MMDGVMAVGAVVIVGAVLLVRSGQVAQGRPSRKRMMWWALVFVGLIAGAYIYGLLK
ncbi:hypothetical protein J2T38_000444 [Neisseria perflava]|uniref:hypothetical protein n=1 Tax=Neisseria perflava TaxID=33053 RepID=UPI00209E803C|nr:hypothetical protein [Neisseria perflava]MCP1771644.1 hypothetical protein [Neisseria perflava]